MRTVYLPYVIGKIVQILSYIAVFVLDMVHFVLTPFTWIQFKGHAAMFAMAGAGYAYLHFIAHEANAAKIAVLSLVAAIAAVLLIKLARKMAHRVRQSLVKIVYSPIGVCIHIRPLFRHRHHCYLKNVA